MDKIYYHGSNSKFTTFDKSKIRENKLGLCFNFTDDYSMAYQYGDNILKVHLDLKNPLTKEILNSTWTYEQDEMLAKKLGFPGINKEDFDDTETFGEVYEIFKMRPAFIELLEEMGYDGIAFPEEHHYGVFEPEQIHVIGDEMKESLEKLGEKLYPTYFTKSAYDIANLIKNKPEPYRILFDKTYGYWLIGNGNVLTHIDLLYEAGDAALYYNEKDFDGHEYYENNLANNGGENNLCRLVFMPRYAYDGPGAGYASDGYNLKYYIETGVIYANNLYPLEDTELGKLLNIEDVEDIEDMDESLNERLEEINSGIYATKSAYDIINWMKNKPKPYRIIYDSNINQYFIGDAFDYIHQDMLEEAFYSGFYPDMLSANEVDDYSNKGMENKTMLFFSFDPEGGGLIDSEKSSDGYTRKYVYDFGTIYSHEFTPLEDFELYKILGEPVKKETVLEHVDFKKLNTMLEGFLKDYEEIATIIKDNKGYNVIEDGEKLLINSYGSLKRMLQDISKNMEE